MTAPAIFRMGHLDQDDGGTCLSPNGSRLSCGRSARRRRCSGRSPCAAGHDTLLPLKRSPPASFTRLLGGNFTPPVRVMDRDGQNWRGSAPQPRPVQRPKPPHRLGHHAGALWASRAPVWTAIPAARRAFGTTLGEVVERLLRMSPRGAEKVTAEREDESFDRWSLPRELTASP